MARLLACGIQVDRLGLALTNPVAWRRWSRCILQIVKIWIDGWQMQCCGDAFSLGSKVSWHGHAVVDREFLGSFLDRSDVEVIEYSQEHHGAEDGDLVRIEGNVVSIAVVSCRYEPTTADPMMHVPVEDSGTIEPLTSATGWEENRDDDRQFVGYVVELVDGEVSETST